MKIEDKHAPLILDALEDIENKIKKLVEQKQLINDLDVTKSVTEEQWHMFCETPLRTSNIMGVLLKNTFPDAESIKVKANHVFFELYGIECAIPTYRDKSVMINTDWAKRETVYNQSPEIKEKYIIMATKVIPELEKFSTHFYERKNKWKDERPLDIDKFKQEWSPIYTIVAFDKDGGIYDKLAEGLIYKDAISKAEELFEDLEEELLQRENGEPYDWIEIYKNYNTEDEELIWYSYEKEEREL